jgi:hypothetical protein
MHGGLSPDLNSMEQIRRIMRPTDVPDTGLLCDLLWSDPDEKITGCVSLFFLSRRMDNDRKVSRLFPEYAYAFSRSPLFLPQTLVVDSRLKCVRACMAGGATTSVESRSRLAQTWCRSSCTNTTWTSYAARIR